MDNSSSKICLYSYNSRGSSEEKLNYIQDIINVSGNKIPIFLVQEHFLLRSNIYKLSKFFNTSAVLAKPAFKNFETQNTGRPMGGLATIVPKYLRKHTKVMNCESWRLQPILFKFGNKEILIINSYFPTDPKTINSENQDLISTLAVVTNLIETTTFHSLYLAGDLNCEFMRKSSHVRAVREFMTRLNLVSVWDYHDVDFTHTFEKETGEVYHHTIDHILTLNRSQGSIECAGAIHRVENMSDHEPIFAVIGVEASEKNEDVKEAAGAGRSKPVWKMATEDQKLEFNDILFRKLIRMEIPESIKVCSDIKCSDEHHKEEIDTFVKELLENVSESGHETLPIVTPKAKKNLRKSTPGWKDCVEPFQDEAHFWHNIWCSAGRPQNTELHRIMKKTRNVFHYQVRKCRRVENYLRNQNIIENCVENDKDLFAEIRKQRSNDNHEDVTIDGAAGKDIPNKFAGIYKELFNREEDDANIELLSRVIDSDMNEEAKVEIEKINSEKVKEAMNKIKPNKSDPIYDFSSDFLINAPDILFEQLALILNSFVIHGHVTEMLLLATLVPIVKDKLGDLCSSKNYRSIAISSLILKLLDWVILLNYSHLLKCDDFQFGFQELSNTSLCSWVVYETIEQYVRKGSIVYGCLLDCTKAFDTIKHSLLFKKLLEANVPPIIVRLLISIYRRQMANVRWKSDVSDQFSIRNGVRQGAIASPILFCFYMDRLFHLLKVSGSGCMIGNFYGGVHGYADDLLFLCPSRSGLQEMLDIASKYAAEHKISFSTDVIPAKSKTKGIVFSDRKLRFNPVPIKLNGNPLPWVEQSKYLGNRITGLMDGYSSDVREKRARFIERNCELNQEFYFAHPEVKSRINMIYNSSFSGSVLWDMTSANTQMIINSWSVAVRHMWGLPYNAHRYLMEKLSGTHAKTMLLCRYIKFIKSIQKSPKLAVQFLYQKIRKNLNTVTGKNINFVLKETGYDEIESINTIEVKKRVKFCEVEESGWKADFIKEIVDLKHNVLTLDDNGGMSFDKEELDDIIDYICTS